MINKAFKVGLLGFGTVGQGVYQIINKSSTFHASISKICVKNPEKNRSIQDKTKIVFSLDDFFSESYDMVVEAITDAEVSFQAAKYCLENGIPFISASKNMLAHHLPELIHLQQNHQIPLLYEASACGSIPIIRNLEEYYDNDFLLYVKGILNATSNVILSKMTSEKFTYEQALLDAQQNGFAEADPYFDVAGYDSLHKLVIIGVHALGSYVAPDQIFRSGIQYISPFDIHLAQERGKKIKLLGIAIKLDEQHFTMMVVPTFVDRCDYMYNVENEYNGVIINGHYYEKQFMFGKGAGAFPTSSAIISDLSAATYNYKYEYKKMKYFNPPQYTRDVQVQIYIRYEHAHQGHVIDFVDIDEKFYSKTSNFTIGWVELESLHKLKQVIENNRVFLVFTGKYRYDEEEFVLT